MSDAYRITPDADFLRDTLADGGEDLKQCFQCATCSVVCELSDGFRPFPRKEMIWAQWGLKDRLVADPDLWLCHQCNDCSTRCPRAARPGDVLAALRRQTVEHYAVPQWLGRSASRVKYLPLMFLVPALLLAAALWVKAPLWGSARGVLHYFQHEGFYANLFPHWLLIGFFSFFWGLAMLGGLAGIVRFWQGMKAADEAAGGYQPTLGITAAALRTLAPIFSHGQFARCQGRASRRWAHLGVFYGFAALFLVSVWAVVALYVINPLIADHAQHLLYPFALGNPWKILANLGCVALIGGCALAIRDRITNREQAGASTSFDWVFVWLLLGVGITGLLSEILRVVAEPAASTVAGTLRVPSALANPAADGTRSVPATSPALNGYQYTAYTVYFLHLVVVFQLLVYLPYSKFAHVLYRTVALIYAERTGRGRAEMEKPPGH